MMSQTTARPDPAAACAAGSFGLVADATVLTREGVRPAAELRPGMRVITRDGGFRTLAAATVRRVTDGPLVRIAAGALGPSRPERDLLLAPGQRVLLRGACAVARFGVAQAIAPAAALVDGDAIAVVKPSQPLDLCTLAFAHDHLIYAEGVELLCPAAAAAAG